MIRRPYHFTVHLEEGVVGRAWLNDLPVQKLLTRGPDSMGGGASHLLVPGKNRLVLEILRLPPPGSIPPVGMKIYRIVDADTTPILAEMLQTVELPAALNLPVGKTPELPIWHVVDFELPEPVVEPPWWRSPRIETPCSGTKELIDLVLDLQDAVEKLDLRRFFELVSLKHEHWAAAYAGDPYAPVERQQEGATEFFKLSPKVRPLDVNRLHFHPRCGGRVVHVSAWDDGPVIEAIAPAAGEDEPTPALRANLLVTHHEGRYRIFG